MANPYPIDLPAQFPFTTELQVQVQDVNYGNHLGHDRLISLLHEARIRFLQQHGLSEIDAGGAGLTVASLACNYLAEVQHGEHLRIDVAVINPGRARCDMVYRVHSQQQNRVVAEARTSIVFYNYTQGKVVRIPEAIRQLVTSHVD